MTKTPPTTQPLLRLIAREIVREYLAELVAVPAPKAKESKVYSPPLARTGTDGE